MYTKKCRRFGKDSSCTFREIARCPKNELSTSLCGAGFAFHRTGEGGFGYKISSPAVIFTAKLTVLFVTLQHVEEVTQPPEKCVILTDSLSSVKALLFRKILHRNHPLVYECKQICSKEDREWS
jgi:hypothetical protein